jgi:hypothetical protein
MSTLWLLQHPTSTDDARRLVDNETTSGGLLRRLPISISTLGTQPSNSALQRHTASEDVRSAGARKPAVERAPVRQRVVAQIMLGHR